MRLIIALLMLFSAGLGVGQTLPRTYLPLGHIPAELTRKIDTQTARVGDAVLFRTVRKTTVGTTVIPLGAKLTGRIVAVKTLTDQRQPSELSFVIDRADWKDATMPLHAVVVGFGAHRYASGGGLYYDPESRYIGMTAAGKPIVEGPYPAHALHGLASGGGSTFLEREGIKGIELEADGPEGAGRILNKKHNVVLKKGTLVAFENRSTN